MPIADLLRGVRELDEHAEQFKKAEQYAEGTRPEAFASARMRRAMAANDVSFKINLARVPVKVFASRLEVASITVPGNEPATAAIEALWERNELDVELPNAIRKACSFGDAYLAVWPGDEPGTADIWVRTPLTTVVLYAEDNPRRKVCAVFRMRHGKAVRVNLLYADRTEKWITLAGKDGGEEGDWVPYQGEDEDGGQEAWPLPHPDGVDEVPVYHLRTDRPHGRPVHLDAWGAQDLVTKLITSHAASVDYQSGPQRYALAEAAVDSDDDAGIDFGADDAQAEAADSNAEKISKLKAGPDQLWYMEGVKTVGQFDPPDPALFTDPISLYVRLMAVTTDVPLHHFDPSGDQPSGESRRVANEGLNKAVGALKVAFASPLKRAMAQALKIMGLGDVSVDVRWVPNETPDGLEAWQTVGEKIDAGVPTRQALLEAGYTTEQVDEWLTESEDEDLMRRILALKELGAATQSLGTAVGFGVVSVDQVQRAVAALLGEEPQAVQVPAAPVIEAAPPAPEVLADGGAA